MRLPNSQKLPLMALVVSLYGLASGPVFAGDSRMPASARPINGPAADYPVVLGESFSVGDVSFTPSNAMNYDAVGLASVSQDGIEGVSAAHHTLPVPSYVEITSLDSGKTILVRVDRRGPMTSTNIIEISAAAAAQLGLSGGGNFGGKAGVRVRRANPPEVERAALRAGGMAPERMPTPKALLSVLQRKLNPNSQVLLARSTAGSDENGGVSAAPVKQIKATALAKPALAPVKPASAKWAMQQPVVPSKGPATIIRTGPSSGSAAGTAPLMTGASYVKPISSGFAGAFDGMSGRAGAGADKSGRAPANPTLTKAQRAAIKAPSAPLAMPGGATSSYASTVGARIAPSPTSSGGSLIIQAGAFSVKANAQASAAKLGANIQSTGSIWRVRVGPFESRQSAEAALVKVKAAGYSGARIQQAG